MARSSLAVVFLAVAEAAFVWLGLALAQGPFTVSPIWPAAGLGLAVVYMFGYRTLPVLFTGMVAANLYLGRPFLLAIVMNVPSIVFPALGAYLLRRYSDLGSPASDVKDVLIFLAAVAATSVASALLGVVVLFTFADLPSEAIASTFLTWWSGDTIGAIIVTPAVLACLIPGRRQEVDGRYAEAFCLVVATAAASVVAFWGSPFGTLPDLHAQYVLLPFLIWAAIRFHVFGAAIAIVTAAAVATAASVMGTGLYGSGSGADLAGLQLLLGSLAASTLVLGVATKRKDVAVEEARHQARFIDTVARNMPGALYRRRLDADGRVSYPYMAGRFAQEFGLGPETLTDHLDRIRSPTAAGLRCIHRADRVKLQEELRRSADTLEPMSTELRYVSASGNVSWARSQSIPHRAGDAILWDGFLIDITEEKRQRDQVEHLARHDPLTHLANRRGFAEMCERALARAKRHGSRLAVCLIDMDSFKGINDGHGHVAGDTVITAVSERIRETMRVEDIKARMGGDEFAVVQTDIHDSASAAMACERLLDRISEPVECGSALVHPGASIGIAMYPDDGDTMERLLMAADQALYMAKARRQGDVVFYHPEMSSEVQSGGDLGYQLRTAIRRGELHIVYQPQIDVVTHQVRGVEALVRWDHVEQGPIAPSEFVPLAEDRGLIGELDLYVIERALTDLQQIGLLIEDDLQLSVNVSGASLRDELQRERFARCLSASGIDPDRVELELTETTLVHAADQRVIDGLHQLAGMGVRFTVDDFGVGYGSLTYLRSLPIARIKIDRSFVKEGAVSEKETEILRALLRLGNSLGLEMIAEGVESVAEVERLIDLGCTYVQGFYYSEALPPEELVAYIEVFEKHAAERSLS